MKINDRVYVSIISTSKVAGETGTIVAINGDEVKVKTDFGVIGYPRGRFLTLVDSDAPSQELVNEDKAKTKAGSGYVFDNDTNSMYLTPVTKKYEDPTDLLCKVVNFRKVNLENGMILHRNINGWVTDQWYENGEELLNIVHDGDFTVVARRNMNFVW
ncbi:MotB-like transcriptional regulator [Pectobacterium bacteriophage PM2]|uniref:Uncharacterized protein n=1 Tax=Pectobacterium bacteriophage PM2 TaxID=1429794 RepID=A0A0A0Q3A2_9CAUD|nr:MotB-like transcriptional regulator [Pectobacterium bacteriophage PM2]AHY24972.1 hypothetical protein PM2_010 [Pectobacterium bacteriophage PM2]